MAFALDLSGNRDTVDFASLMVTAVATLGSEKISDLGWFTKDPETGAAVARDKLHSFLHTGARLIRHRGTGMSRSTTALTSAAQQTAAMVIKGVVAAWRAAHRDGVPVGGLPPFERDDEVLAADYLKFIIWARTGTIPLSDDDDHQYVPTDAPLGETAGEHWRSAAWAGAARTLAWAIFDSLPPLTAFNEHLAHLEAENVKWPGNLTREAHIIEVRAARDAAAALKDVPLPLGGAGAGGGGGGGPGGGGYKRMSVFAAHEQSQAKRREGASNGMNAIGVEFSPSEIADNAIDALNSSGAGPAAASSGFDYLRRSTAITAAASHANHPSGTSQHSDQYPPVPSFASSSHPQAAHHVGVGTESSRRGRKAGRGSGGRASRR